MPQKIRATAAEKFGMSQMRYVYKKLKMNM